MEEIRKNVLSLTRSEINQPLINGDGIQFETDSSDKMDVFTPTSDEIIRLEEMASEPTQQTSLTLAIGLKYYGCFSSSQYV